MATATRLSSRADDGIETTASVTVGTSYTDLVGNAGTGGGDTVSIDTLNPNRDSEHRCQFA